jgi:indolepyruvate ferredoxin oxidoreductase
MKENQTGAMLRSTELQIDTDGLRHLLQRHAGARRIHGVNAHEIATRMVGAKYVNMFLFGFAWQHGLVPLPLEAIARAIALNGAEVEDNQLAFSSGRVVAADPGGLAEPGAEARPRTLAETIAAYSAYLSAYQNSDYAARYRRRVDSAIAAAERVGDSRLAQLTADNLFKLMAYKDEYEVARLLSSKSFLDGVRAAHGARAKLTFHLRPPVLPDGWSRRTTPGKFAVGQWILPFMRILAGLRWLRGTRFDPFACHADRRQERKLLAEYEAMLDYVLPLVNSSSLAAACELLAVPASIRGYGHIKRPALQAGLTRLGAARQVFDAALKGAGRVIQLKRVG